MKKEYLKYLISAILIIGGICLAIFKIENWGWLIVAGVIVIMD
jgi:hypothetical protein